VVGWLGFSLYFSRVSQIVYLFVCLLFISYLLHCLGVGDRVVIWFVMMINECRGEAQCLGMFGGALVWLWLVGCWLAGY